MVVKGWTLLFNQAIIGQVKNLAAAYDPARRVDPTNFRSNANVKLLAALARLLLEVIPADPGRPEYRQGNTLGEQYRHWFRARFLGRFRLFFRYDSRARIIVYAWVNDERSLYQRGGRHDTYETFRGMLAAGNPPDEWSALVRSSARLPTGILPSASGSRRPEAKAE
jgi:toxin YhaV